MAFSTMYLGKTNSPATTLASGIDDNDTTISCADASVLPAAPNIAILGSGEDAETISYTGKSGNDLTGVTRPFEGSAKAWGAGTQIARFFTNADYAALIANITKLAAANIKNLIIDGGFLHWLSTTSEANPATNTYTHTLSKAVHAKTSGTRPTITISRQNPTNGDLNNSSKIFRVAASGADSSLDNGSYYIALRHYIYQGTRHYTNGQKITIGFRAKSSVANQKIAVCLRQNYGTTGSPTSDENIAGTIFTLTTSWAEYSYTFTTNTLSGKTFGTDENDALIVDIFAQAGSTVASSLFSGSAFGFTEAVNIDLTELRAFPGEELYNFRSDSVEAYNKIKAFYEKSYPDSVKPGTASTTTGAVVWYNEVVVSYNGIMVWFGKKIRQPTITVYSTDSGASAKIYNGTDGDDVAVTYGYVGQNSFKLTFSGAVGANKSCMGQWVADARY